MRIEARRLINFYHYYFIVSAILFFVLGFDGVNPGSFAMLIIIGLQGYYTAKRSFIEIANYSISGTEASFMTKRLIIPLKDLDLVKSTEQSRRLVGKDGRAICLLELYFSKKDVNALFEEIQKQLTA